MTAGGEGLEAIGAETEEGGAAKEAVGAKDEEAGHQSHITTKMELTSPRRRKDTNPLAGGR
jgi:hypothetical protein